MLPYVLQNSPIDKEEITKKVPKEKNFKNAKPKRR
jgi:hypothetical protein